MSDVAAGRQTVEAVKAELPRRIDRKLLPRVERKLRSATPAAGARLRGALRCWTVAVLGLAASLMLAGSAQAASFTLAELVAAPDDFRFQSANGLLSFGHFEVTISGTLLTDLSQYTVVTNGDVIADGFQLIGMIGVAGGNAGDITLQYDVFASSILSAEMFFNGRAFGEGALANVTEDFFSLPGLELLPENLTVFATGGDNGSSQRIDAVLFQNPLTSMRVVKDIQVISDGGIFASISIIDQHFTAVPEPNSALLLGLGLCGLMLKRRGAGSAPRAPAPDG